MCITIRLQVDVVNIFQVPTQLPILYIQINHKWSILYVRPIWLCVSIFYVRADCELSYFYARSNCELLFSYSIWPQVVDIVLIFNLILSDWQSIFMSDPIVQLSNCDQSNCDCDPIVSSELLIFLHSIAIASCRYYLLSFLHSIWLWAAKLERPIRSRVVNCRFFDICDCGLSTRYITFYLLHSIRQRVVVFLRTLQSNCELLIFDIWWWLRVVDIIRSIIFNSIW